MNLVRKIFLHGIIWVALIVFMMFIGNHGEGLTYRTVINFVYFGILNIAIFYINYLIILPKFLKNRRYWASAIAIVILIGAFGFIKLGVSYYFRDIVWMKDSKVPADVYLQKYYLSTLFISGFFVFISTTVKFMGDWFVNEKERRSLEKEILSAELSSLRSQINPHFLFNCLN
ncbi:MAG TPA: histidine kinase, partial [Sphingobacteriaceae bacterium]